MKIAITCLFFLVLLGSCRNEPDNFNRDPESGFDGTGYIPIYASDEEIHKIEVLDARPLKSPGKIYKLGTWLFVNEAGKGIHLINNANPREPVNAGFISIPGNYDMAAKGNFLYADNLADLVVLDISNPENVSVSKRVEGAIPVQSFPQEQNVFFECVDVKKGNVVGWEKVSMSKAPGCRR